LAYEVTKFTSPKVKSRKMSILPKVKLRNMKTATYLETKPILRMTKSPLFRLEILSSQVRLLQILDQHELTTVIEIVLPVAAEATKPTINEI